MLGDIDVGNVLVLAEKGQVEYNLEGLSVGGKDNEVSNTSVEGFGRLIGSLLELLVELGLVKEIHDLLGQGVVSSGPSSRLGGFYLLVSRFHCLIL